MDLPKEFEINCTVLHLFHVIRLRDLSGDKDHIRGHENKGKDFQCGVAVSPSNFILLFFFCSHKHVFKGFSLFCKR